MTIPELMEKWQADANDMAAALDNIPYDTPHDRAMCRIRRAELLACLTELREAWVEVKINAEIDRRYEGEEAEA